MYASPMEYMFFLFLEVLIVAAFIAFLVSGLILEWRIKYGKTITKGGTGFTARVTITRDEKSMDSLKYVFGGAMGLSALVVSYMDETLISKLYFTSLNSLIFIYLFFYSSPFRKILFKELKRIRED